jgi:drug/metabolite transporter (DMT)-like permease
MKGLLVRLSRAGTRENPVTLTAPPQAAGRLALFAPVLLAAGAFAFADVFVKVALNDGADALTIVTARGVLALPLIYCWLRLSGPITPLTPRERWISYGLGLLFAGNIFLLIEAIRIITVPVAILTYFVYPLLTGLAAGATGIEKLTWRGVTAAIIALCGLALMLGAHPTALAALGVVAAIAAACCRVALLLITRAAMQGADARLITWHSSISTSVVFVGLSLLLMHWQPPASAAGWVVVVLLGIAMTAGILGIFASTARIGPFRTALFMNLEPPLTAVGSALILGEVVTPLQAVGGAIMIGALVAFQLRR